MRHTGVAGHVIRPPLLPGTKKAIQRQRRGQVWVARWLPTVTGDRGTHAFVRAVICNVEVSAANPVSDTTGFISSSAFCKDSHLDGNWATLAYGSSNIR